jgi:hypothetical protein
MRQIAFIMRGPVRGQIAQKSTLKSSGEGLEELDAAIQIVEGKMLQFRKTVKFLGLEG